VTLSQTQAEIDLIDQTGVAQLDPPETSLGIFPQLAALEMIVRQFF
jgi:hypothetical protein